MRNFNGLLFLFSVSLFFVAQNAFGAGYELQEQSAPAMSRVLAVNAKFSDPSVVFYNPAQMVYLEGLNISFGTVIATPVFNYKDPEGGYADASTKIKPVTPVHFYLTYSLTKNLSIGGGVSFAPWGLAIYWPDDFAGNFIASSADLKIPLFMLNAAYKLFDGKLAIGGFFSFSPSSIELTQRITLADDSGNLKKMDVKLGGTGIGYGGGVGIAVRPFKHFYFGASYRSRIVVDFDGSAHFSLPPGVEDQSTFHDQDVKTTFKAPDVFGFGIGYDISDTFYLEFDTHYTLWGINDDLEVKFIDTSGSDDGVDLSFTKPQNWKSGFCFRLGGEYSGINNLILRAGIGYDQTPIPDETLSPMLPGSDRIFGSVGAQYFFKKIGLNIGIAYQFTHFVSRTVKSDRSYDSFPQEYHNQAHLLGITVGWKYK